MTYYGGIEAGGTKFVCAVADENMQVVAETRFPTTTPVMTLAAVQAFFSPYQLDSLAVGAFGPVGINPQRADYGRIGQTPKSGWAQYDLLGNLHAILPVPTYLTTDVNVAAYGEYRRGASQGLSNSVYLTVGTGIGAGVIVDGHLYAGRSHPEMGHIYVRRDPADTYVGGCPYHHDCLEGLAAGPSLKARSGIAGQKLPADNPAWQFVAEYLAQGLMTYTLSFAPDVIVLGGGVMNQQALLPAIRRSFVQQLNGYVDVGDVDRYLVPWQMANESGIQGALLLAQELRKG